MVKGAYLELKPDELLRLRDSLYVSNLSIVAMHYLDLFNFLDKTPSTFKKIMSRLGIRKNKEKFELTDLSRAYLTKNSDYDLSSYFLPFKETSLCKEIFHVLKTDNPAKWAGQNNTSNWHTNMEQPSFANTFIHDWREEKVKILLKKSHDALPKGGHIVILDAHLNDVKTGPLEVAELSVLLMCMTQGKCYSRKEMYNMLKETGFKNSTYIDLHFAYRSVIIAEK